MMTKDGRDAVGGTVVEFICVIDRLELELPEPGETPSGPKKAFLATISKHVEQLIRLAARVLRGAVLLHDLLTKFCF
jgi:hypothetical protein